MENAAAKAHILIVDDDVEIRSLLADFLKAHGYRATTVHDGRGMWQALETTRVDLIVLDLMLPGEDGLSLCRRLRVDSTLPVIMLTAMGEETERIVGLEMGADDYLPKPFNPHELLARIKAVLRRQGGNTVVPENSCLRFDRWLLNTRRRELHCEDEVREVELTSGEYDLLLALVERPQRVLNRDQLLDITRGREAMPFDRSIDVMLSRLRRKIEVDPKQPRLIKTVRGGGYMLTARVEPC